MVLQALPRHAASSFLPLLLQDFWRTEVLIVAETKLGKTICGVAGALLVAGGLQLALAEEDKAAPQEATAAIHRGPVGNDHTAQWRIYTDLGRKSAVQGDSKKAEQYLRRALQEAREGFGKEDAHVASAENNLAELYRVMHQFDKAELLYMEALQKLLKAFGPDDLRVAQAYSNAASCFAGQNSLEQARSYSEKALQVRKAALGDRHVAVAASLKPLAQVHWRLGDHAAAITLLQECCDILTPSDTADPVHAHQQGWMRESGDLFNMLLVSGMWSEAAELQQRRLQRLVPASERSVFDIATMEQYAEVLHQCGRTDEARSMLQECLSLLTAKDGPAGISVGVILQHMADLEIEGNNQASWQRAHNLARESCDILKEATSVLEKVAAGAAKQQGWTKWLQSDSPQGDALVAKAKAAMPAAAEAHGRSWHVLGQAQLKLGRVEDARDSWIRSLSVLFAQSAAAPTDVWGHEGDADDEATPRLLGVILLGVSIGRMQKVGPLIQTRRRLHRSLLVVQDLSMLASTQLQDSEASVETDSAAPLPSTLHDPIANKQTNMDRLHALNNDPTHDLPVYVQMRATIRTALADVKSALASHDEGQ